MSKNSLKPQKNQKLNRNELKKVMGGGPIGHCPESCFIDENLPGGSSCTEPLQCLPFRCEGGWNAQTCQ